MKETLPPLEDLRRGFAALSATAAPRGDCPAPEAIWDALRGESPTDSAATVVEHTSRCYACAEVWRLDFEFSGRKLPSVVSGTRAPAFKVWVGLAAAAVLLVAAGIGIMMMPRGSQPVVTRSGEETAITSLVPETAPLPRGACTLRWSSPSAQARYTLRVGTEDLSPIASGQNLDHPEYTVPEKNLEKLLPGATIVWRVEADLPDGRHIASPAFRNKVE